MRGACRAGGADSMARPFAFRRARGTGDDGRVQAMARASLDLTTQVHLVAGLLALGLGAAALVRDPSRGRVRLLFALCAALATWNLAAAARHAALPGREAWRAATYVGACLSAPLALHLSLAIAREARGRRRLLLGSYALAAGTLALTWSLRARPAWERIVALALPMALVLAQAVGVLRRHARSLGTHPDRRALRTLMALGLAAAAFALTDLIPRGGSGVPPLGPLALIPFLLALSTLALQRRYVDLDRVVARVAAIILAGAAAGAFLQSSVALLGPSPLTFFLASLVIVAFAGPLVGAILSGTRALLGAPVAASRALEIASQELAAAADAEAAWRALHRADEALPGGQELRVLLGAQAPPAGSPLAARLVRDGAAITRQLLEADALDPDGAQPGRGEQARAALVDMDARGLVIAAPLLRDGELAGVVGIGGGEAGPVTAETGAALVALGHQALMTFDRVKEAERSKRREALALVGEMAASLAHDVRNPLAALRAAAQVLAQTRGPGGSEQEREMLSVIEDETARLGRTLGELLEWAKPREPARAPVDVAAVARRVVREARLAWTGAAIDLDVDARAAAGRVLGDEELIARAVANLVRNAIEAAGEGAVRVVVRDDPAGMAIEVEDDGEGVPDAVRERIFEPFVTTRRGGTGLGLAIVQRVAEAHGGEARVASRTPRGTRFTLLLRRRAGHDRVEAP